MQDHELKAIWQSYDNTLAQAQVLNMQSWALNFKCFETLQQEKAKGRLRSLIRFKVFAVVLGMIWVCFLSLLVWGNRFQNPFFSISVSAIAFFSLYAVWVYLYHIVLISQIRYDGAITETQKKLAGLQSSTFQSTRIIWLQLPFYTTWFWSTEWVLSGDSYFWLIAFPISIIFLGITLYLYRNIRIENMNRKWVKALMMSGPEYKNLVQSMSFMAEIDDFKKELA